MIIRPFSTLLLMGLLAACAGNGSDARRGDADRQSPPARDSAVPASSWQEFEREVERERMAGGDSSGVRVNPSEDGRTAVVSRIRITRDRAGDRSARPPDTLPRIADSAPIAGIMRWDGVIAPFAAFDDGRWIRVPQGVLEGRNARAPISSWYFFAVHGPKRVVRGERLVEPGECLLYESWGLATDLQPDTLPWTELFDSERDREWAGWGCPTRRIGLALSRDLKLVRMTEVETDGPEADRLLQRVRSGFDEREARDIGHLRPDTADPGRHWTGHPISASERARSALRLTSLRRRESGAGEVHILHFVVMRSYPAVIRNGRACPTETKLGGFVVGDGDPVFLGSGLGLRGACSDSPGMSGLAIEPYGLLRLDGRWFLLGVEEGYEWSAPVIYEIEGDRLTEVLRGW